jgi:thiamine biosynthesis lipoprotein
MCGSVGSATGVGSRRRTIEAVVAGVALLGALVAAYLLRDASSDREVLHLTGETMSTRYSVKVVEPGAAAAREAIDGDVKSELELVDRLMSRYRKGSELDRLNRNPGTEPVEVSPELLEVLARARRISERTDGAFDVTVGPLIEIWGFDERRALAETPAADALAEVRLRVGYRLLEIDEEERSVRKRHAGLNIDLSAIAKGYAVDRIATALERLGHRDYLVEVGGEVRCSGASHRGTPWRVAIERPSPGARQVFRVVELSGRALATSGDYRNFYELDGRRVSHTIDPRTGRPVEHGLASVTVIGDECVAADALATGLTVLGLEHGLALAERLELHALFISRSASGELSVRGTSRFERAYPVR